MDETTLRGLGTELLAELPERIPDAAERAPVAGALEAALATPEGEGRAPLLDALSAHPATRSWMRENGATDDGVRGGLPGNPTTPLGLYYVCVNEDDDLILYTAPAQPPQCPTCGSEMRREQG